MKALVSFAILITIFSEPFFTDGSPQPLDIEKLIPINKKTLGSLLDSAKKAIAEKDGKSEFLAPMIDCTTVWINILTFYTSFN
jgi:hypothetical protein